MVGFAVSEKNLDLRGKLEAKKATILRFTLLSISSFMLGRITIIGFLNPFSIGLLCASIVNGSSIFPIALGILLGVFSRGNPEMLLWHLSTIAPLLLSYIILKKTSVKKSVLFSILGFVFSFSTGFFIYYIKNYYLYDLLMVIIQALMICLLTNIYDKGLFLLTDFKKRRILSTEEIISCSVLCISIFLGPSIYIWRFHTKAIVSVFLMLLFSYSGNIGVGGAVGTILGVLLYLSNDIYSSAIGLFSICGLLISVLRKFGRVPMVLGLMVANLIITFCINGYTETLVGYTDVLAASLLFLLFPKKYLEALFSMGMERSLSFCNGVHRSGLEDYTIEKLKEISYVFKELSVSMSANLDSKNYYSQMDAVKIIEKTVKETCASCGMYESCWEEHFYKTYQKVFNILTAIESNKAIDDDMINILKDHCLFPDRIWDNLKCNYDLYKSSCLWRRKIDESRAVFSRQMEETSKLILQLAKEFNIKTEFDRGQEERIAAHLDSLGIDIKGVTVIKNRDNLEIDLNIKGCSGNRECIKNIIPEIKEITGRNFIKPNLNCVISDKGICNLRLREAYKYSVAMGIARKQKEVGSISGDNYSYIEKSDGRSFVILSDGMGSGPQAALESGIAVNLLEKFLQAGYDYNSALEFINSILLIKSDEENYTTLDISIINQHNGEVEFLKVGAVSTFIKYRDRVEIVNNNSLPAGILHNIDFDLSRRKLRSGDFIIMVTDGVLDANKNELDKERWLAKVICEIDTRNPQKIADYIMESCMKKAYDIPVDDITILVAKVYESKS